MAQPARVRLTRAAHGAAPSRSTRRLRLLASFPSRTNCCERRFSCTETYQSYRRNLYGVTPVYYRVQYATVRVLSSLPGDETVSGPPSRCASATTAYTYVWCVHVAIQYLIKHHTDTLMPSTRAQHSSTCTCACDGRTTMTEVEGIGTQVVPKGGQSTCG